MVNEDFTANIVWNFFGFDLMPLGLIMCSKKCPFSTPKVHLAGFRFMLILFRFWFMLILLRFSNVSDQFFCSLAFDYHVVHLGFELSGLWILCLPMLDMFSSRFSTHRPFLCSNIFLHSCRRLLFARLTSSWESSDNPFRRPIKHLYLKIDRDSTFRSIRGSG